MYLFHYYHQSTHHNYSIVHIAWSDIIYYHGLQTDYDIFYKRWITGTTPNRIEMVSTDSPSDSDYASIAVDKNGTLHIVWINHAYELGSKANVFYNTRLKTPFPEGTNDYDLVPENPSISGYNLFLIIGFFSMIFLMIGIRNSYEKETVE